MAIRSDRWIRRMSEEHGMIEPFEHAVGGFGGRLTRVARALDTRRHNPVLWRGCHS